MKLACFYILKKRLNYCDFISYRRYLVLHELFLSIVKHKNKERFI